MGKKKVIGEDGKTYTMKEKKPFYKKVWFWILAVIVVIAVGGSLNGGSDKDSAATASTKEKQAETKNAATKESKDDSVDLKQTFEDIKIGDIMSNGEGGSTLEEVKQKLGEPNSTSETNIEGQNTKALSWTSLKGGDIMSSMVISFSNDKAVSKTVTGLKTNDHDKVTLEQFNAVVTDGSYTEEQARNDFGEPDSITSTLINGQTQDLLSWSKHVNGELGANFNVTFDNGGATSKAQMSMQ